MRFRLRPSFPDALALGLSLLAVVVALGVAERVFEQMPHLEDEVAYVWQARLIAQGKLMLPSPSFPQSFLVPFVVDYQGERFGKYPLGWPALLGVGIRLGLRTWVNPLLAGLAVWLTYRLGRRIFGVPVGLLAAGLTLTSPFFLMNSGSLLSHPLGLVLSAAMALGWWEAFGPPSPSAAENPARRRVALVAAALSLGLLVLTRPLTAVGVALPFACHGLYLLLRSDGPTRWRLVVFGALVLLLGSVHFVWQAAVTGDALLNPYTLWWPYDKVGFGPGVGVRPDGHTLHQAYLNTRLSLKAGASDLFGWGAYSWLLLPAGLLALVRLRRHPEKRTWEAHLNWGGLLVSGVFVALVIVYLAYWIGSDLFGPRYYYEGLYSLTLLTAAGFAWLAGWPLAAEQPWPRFTAWKRLRPLVATAGLAFLVLSNLAGYLPGRLNTMYSLYTINRATLEPFHSAEAQKLTPALVIVYSPRWMKYGNLLELENPQLDSPWIFAWSHNAEIDGRVAQAYPERTVIYYNVETPGKFYFSPLPTARDKK